MTPILFSIIVSNYAKKQHIRTQSIQIIEHTNITTKTKVQS